MPAMSGIGKLPVWTGGDFARRDKEISARRKALLSRMRQAKAVSAEPDLSSQPVSIERAPVALADLQFAADTLPAEIRPEEAIILSEDWTEGTVDQVAAELSRGDKHECLAPIAAEPQNLVAGGWLAEIGLPDRPGLAWISEILHQSCVASPGSVSLVTSWPSQPPSAMLAWAADHVGCSASRMRGNGQPRDGVAKTAIPPSRALFLTDGRVDQALLNGVGLERARMSPVWSPPYTIEHSATWQAMGCAFHSDRLKVGAPLSVPLRDVVPLLHGKPPTSAETWDNEWNGFLGSLRSYVCRKGGGRYGLPWEQFGQTTTTRPFAFSLPRISKGRRRTSEVSSIPGGVDLVIMDFSASWMGPTQVATEVEDAMLDVLAALEHKGLPRFVIIVSDPRASLAVLARLRGMLNAEMLNQRPVRVAKSYIGSRDGTMPNSSNAAAVRLDVHTASTHQAEIQSALLNFASQLENTHPATSACLIAASRRLATMACSLAPPLAGNDTPEVMHTFIDDVRQIREAMNAEGDTALGYEIERALGLGTTAATKLLRQSPASIALEDATKEARQGRRTVFVAESAHEAATVSRSAPENLRVVGRKGATLAISTFCPELIITACRGSDAIRIVAEQAQPSKEVRMLLPPAEAATAGRIAELVLELPEMSSHHPLCQRLIAVLPPSFPGILRLGAILAKHKRRSVTTRTMDASPDRASASIVATMYDGTPAYFAPGSLVILIKDGSPQAHRAKNLVPGEVMVLLPVDVGERIAQELGWSGPAGLLDDEVSRYKARVRTWRNGKGRLMSVRQIVERLQEIEPGMDAPSEAAVRYWLDAGDNESAAKPQASTTRRWFDAFLRLIEMDDCGRLFAHFQRHRGKLQHDGSLREGLLERFLFDRYDAVVQRGVTRERVDQLRALALSHVQEVVAVERGGAYEEEQ